MRVHSSVQHDFVARQNVLDEYVWCGVVFFFPFISSLEHFSGHARTAVALLILRRFLSGGGASPTQLPSDVQFCGAVATWDGRAASNAEVYLLTLLPERADTSLSPRLANAAY